jgi:ubiquinone biosynthesis protein
VGGLGNGAPGLVDLLPAKYQAFRPLVADGVRFFLGKLPREWVHAALAEQIAFPPGTRFPTRAEAFARHFPTLHKLCQVVARDGRLDPDLRRRLQALESTRPAVPVDLVVGALRREIGPSREFRLGARALAEGSVAVVVPFRRDRGGEGVFKILKPGIEDRLGRELDLLGPLGSFLEGRAADLGLPEIPLSETLSRVARQLQAEIRLDVEQVHLATARGFYAGFPLVEIPALLEPCTPRLTAMHRVRGTKVTDGVLEGWQGRWLAEIVAEALLARPFWSPEPVALFHGDPHAGNLLRTKNRRLAVVDWSLAVEVTKADREALAQVVLAGIRRDEKRLCQSVAALAEVEPNPDALRAVVTRALSELSAGTAPSVVWTLRLVDRVALTGRARIPERLLLLAKALFTVRGVLDDLAGQEVANAVLVRRGLSQVLREFPRRFVLSPTWRGFGSHLSTADLVGLIPSWPAAAVRFWARAARRALGGG